MAKRLLLLLTIGVLGYACGGMTTGGIDSGTADSGDSGNPSNDAGGPGSDTGACGSACQSFTGPCATNNSCTGDAVCVTKDAPAGQTHECYPMCGCNGDPCSCVGQCACGAGNSCTILNTGGIYCSGGPVSKGAFKTDVDYVDDEERASLADQVLSTHLAEYRYKTEPETAKRHLGFIIDDMPAGSPAVEADGTHVDLYGYTTMLLATVQEQQREIAELKTQVDALSRAAPSIHPASTQSASPADRPAARSAR